MSVPHTLDRALCMFCVQGMAHVCLHGTTVEGMYCVHRFTQKNKDDRAVDLTRASDSARLSGQAIINAYTNTMFMYRHYKKAEGSKNVLVADIKNARKEIKGVPIRRAVGNAMKSIKNSDIHQYHLDSLSTFPGETQRFCFYEEWCGITLTPILCIWFHVLSLFELKVRTRATDSCGRTVHDWWLE